MKMNTMLKSDKELWVTFRGRLKKALEGDTQILKHDLVMCYKIHKRIYGLPQTAPSINCCIDIDTWLVMIKNVNKSYYKKMD